MMFGSIAGSTTKRSGWRLPAILTLLLATLWSTPETAQAHAFLAGSDPAQGALLPSAPAEIHMQFTEPLEPLYTAAQLFDAQGQLVRTDPATIGPDDNQLSLALPAGLPNGTYTVAWRNISTVDGHPSEGLISFTIGVESDVVVPEAPDATVGFDGPPTIVDALGRWLTFLGIAVALGVTVTRLWVIRPALVQQAESERERLFERLWQLALAGVGLALAGSVYNLVTQTLVVHPDLTLDAVLDLLGESSFGRAWIVRVVLLGLLAAGLLIGRTRMASPSLPRDIVLSLLAAAPFAPISWTSHAAAVEPGSDAAFLTDLAHLSGGGIWAGGLIAVAFSLLHTRGLAADQRSALYAVIIPRFSTIALSSVAVLALTGVYASWLQVGSWRALIDEDYGLVLSAKIGLVVAMVALGAVNLLVLEPRLRRAVGSGMRIGRTVMTEAGLGVIVLLLAGILTSLPTARGELEQQATGRMLNLSDSGTTAHLAITPGTVGVNRYTVDFGIDEDDLPADSVVLMRLTSTGDLAGIQEVELARSGQQRFEATGSELSVAQAWGIELILRRPSQDDWVAQADLALTANAGAQPDAPDPAPRFTGLSGALSAGALLAALALLVIVWRSWRSKALLATAALVALVSILGLAVAYSTVDAPAHAATTPDGAPAEHDGHSGHP